MMIQVKIIIIIMTSTIICLLRSIYVPALALMDLFTILPVYTPRIRYFSQSYDFKCVYMVQNHCILLYFYAF